LRKKIIHRKETTLNGGVGVKGDIHYSYLLRLWQVHNSGEITWRILLENVLSGEKRGFASLEELQIYLYQVINQENEISVERRSAGSQG
jgi:hypothetical protein